jgi:hypothetical protein
LHWPATIEIGPPPEAESHQRRDRGGRAAAPRLHEESRSKADRLSLDGQTRERILQDQITDPVLAAVLGDCLFTACEDDVQGVLEVGCSDPRSEAIDDRLLSSQEMEDMAGPPWGKDSVA